jgi:hypothetical protein
MEPTFAVELTLSEMRAVTKSLSIGVDQLAKKITRLGDSPRAHDVIEEFQTLASAKQSIEAVLVHGMRW